MVNQAVAVERVYAALGDPTRRAMIERLRRGPVSVSELGAPFPMTLAGIGKHVGILESAGLIATTKQGRVRQCTMVPGAFDAAAEWIAETRALWNSGIDRLIARLEAEQ